MNQSPVVAPVAAWVRCSKLSSFNTTTRAHDKPAKAIRMTSIPLYAIFMAAIYSLIKAESTTDSNKHPDSNLTTLHTQKKKEK